MYKHIDIRIASEARTAVFKKSSVFWVTISCSPLTVNWRFGGTYNLFLQGKRICQLRNQNESGSK
jgi:hypothetical protein